MLRQDFSNAVVTSAKRLPPVRCATGFAFPTLSIVTRQQTSKGKVLVQLRPMNAKRRNLDLAQLLRCPSGQPRVFGHRETNLGPALHCDDNVTLAEDGRTCAIG